MDNPIKIVEREEFDKGLDFYIEKQQIVVSHKFYELDLDNYINEDGVIVVLKEAWERWING